MQFRKNIHFNLRRLKKVHLYLCAIFAPKKPHTSLSILENVSSPLLPSPRKALLPVTTSQSVRILSLLSYFLINQVSRAFSPPSLSPSLLCCELILTSFFLCGCSSGLSRVVGHGAGQGSWFAEGGEGRGGNRCEGVVLSSHRTTHCFTSRAPMTCNIKRSFCFKK